MPCYIWWFHYISIYDALFFFLPPRARQHNEFRGEIKAVAKKRHTIPSVKWKMLFYYLACRFVHLTGENIPIFFPLKKMFSEMKPFRFGPITCSDPSIDITNHIVTLCMNKSTVWFELYVELAVLRIEMKCHVYGVQPRAQIANFHSWLLANARTVEFFIFWGSGEDERICRDSFGVWNWPMSERNKEKATQKKIQNRNRIQIFNVARINVIMDAVKLYILCYFFGAVAYLDKFWWNVAAWVCTIFVNG